MKTPVERFQLGLSQVESKAGGAGGATLTFGVKDIDAARGHLEKHDVRFDGDGNTLMFYQDLS